MKTGIVLEGGALRTIFSSGVTDALLEGGIEFDYLVGVSAGIAYGVSYLSKQFGRNLEILTKYANDKRYMGKRNLLKPGNRCYFGLKFIYDDIPNHLVPFDYETFAQWPGTAEAVVTDVETGEAVYLPVPRRDKDFLLLQATCAMPLLFPIYNLDGLKCLDGGAADAVPFRRAFDQGCDRVVVVLTRERSYRRQPEKLQPAVDLRYCRYPKFCETMRRRAEVYNAGREELFRLEREGKVLLLAPDSTQGFSRVEKDVHKIKALWRAGYDQASGRLEEIKAFLT
ncbi:patatin family protein [Pseudoflavonifractor sp. 524-17]|uniref:patatin-like phospholipase family protein n=1 Tax=Pseudoflavonifractor sp. 524-17 TaxID=2304577 RepID=UPI00137AEFE1|nr:patatin family protein [Pseudoflavonifractor sp. 524-17]NCE66376.1 patatin family protein [Pseudoflavonifractor sp. 524-17]